MSKTETIKVKYLFEEIIKGSNPIYVEEPNDYVIFGQRNNTKDGKMSYKDCKYTTVDFWQKREEYEFLKYGDILINSLGGGTCGRVGYFDIPNKKILTDGIPYILRTKDSSKYKYYCLKNIQQELENISIGATNQVSLLEENLRNFKIEIIVDEEKQNKIAHFLDSKISQIDNAISKTKESIEEYKKLKQSIITEAVTKGLDKNVEMKESGNIDFPKIPKTWMSKRTKYVFAIKKEIAGKDGIQVLSITQKGIIPKNIESNEGQIAADYSNYQLVSKGDFAMNHMDLLTGWVDISKYEGVTSPDYRVFYLIDNEKCSSRYYLYLFQMCYFNKIYYHLGQGVSGMGRWRLQADKFMNFIIPVPSKKEQEKIADYLDDQCSKYDMLISKKEKLIEELEQYKKSLIYEYVTGKKEVA